MRKAQGDKLLTLPSGIAVKRAGAILSALTVAEPTTQGEWRLHLYTLADGSIGVYRKRY